MSQENLVCGSDAFVWNRELITSLLVLYEQHPELYRVSSQQYHNRTARQVPMQEICDNINRMHFTQLSISEITKKILGLRSTLLVELNKIKKSESSGVSADKIYIPKWWCFEQLHFLKDHVVVIHQGSSNLTQKQESSEPQNELEMVYEGPNEDVSDTSLMSPSSSCTQSRPDSRVSDNAEEQQKTQKHVSKDKKLKLPDQKCEP